MSTENNVTLRYDSMAQAAAILKRARVWGLKSARDQIAEELVKALIVVVPALLAVVGVISFSSLFAFVCGYLALSWYLRFGAPRLARLIGPRFALMEEEGPLTINLSQAGVNVGVRLQTTDFDWAAFGAVDITKDVIILSALPLQSLPVAASALPEGVTFDGLADDIKRWRGGS